MKIYELGATEEDIAEKLMEMVQEETQRTIFTMRIIGELKDSLETIIVFEDKAMLLGKIIVQEFNGKLACRIQGNFI